VERPEARADPPRGEARTELGIMRKA